MRMAGRVAERKVVLKVLLTTLVGIGVPSNFARCRIRQYDCRRVEPRKSADAITIDDVTDKRNEVKQKCDPEESIPTLRNVVETEKNGDEVEQKRLAHSTRSLLDVLNVLTVRVESCTVTDPNKQDRAGVAYFNAPARIDATPAPPFDSVNLVRIGTNCATMSGDSPSFLN